MINLQAKSFDHVEKRIKAKLHKLRVDNKITDLCVVHALAQMHHETGGFKIFKEKWGYTPEGLLKTFGARVGTLTRARELINSGVKNLACQIYGGRVDLGNRGCHTEDGFLYIGRGAIQLTGRYNYQKFADYVNDQSIMTNPDLIISNDDYFMRTIDFYFDKNKVWDICRQGFDLQTVKAVTKAINGGINGLDDRYKLTQTYLALFEKNKIG